MPPNPYQLPEPFVLSFSGGRTSGYMLHETLAAYGGALPARSAVIFCNTGKEREETLAFVAEVARRWSVPVVWLEYRWEPGRHYFAVVDFATASRKGEPFEAVIKARGFLPNPVTRFCTAEMKIRTKTRYVKQVLGWEEYANAVGFRHDEPKRVAKLLDGGIKVITEETLFGPEDVKTGKRGDKIAAEEPFCPLWDAKVIQADVMAFWQQQRDGMELQAWLDLPADQRPGFDLALLPDEGNCDLCFLKGRGKLVKLLRRRPQDAAWWMEMETRIKGRTRAETARFRHDRPGYAELSKEAEGRMDFFGTELLYDEDDMPCGCTD